MTQLYSLRKAPEGAEGEFTILKFDRDFNLLSIYALTADSCVCPQGSRGKPCRHRKLLPEFIAKGHTNDGWFLDWDTRQWREPLGEASERSESVKIASTTKLASATPACETTDESDLKPLDAQASGAFCVSGENHSHSPEGPPTPAQAPSSHSVARADSVGGSLVRRRRII